MYRWCSNCRDKVGRLKPGQNVCPECKRDTEVEFDPSHQDLLSIDAKRKFRILRNLSTHTDAGMSAVYLVERTDNPERRAVLKIAKIKKLLSLKREVFHLQQLDHPNIIRLAFGRSKKNLDDAILTDQKDGQRLYFIALEFMDGGSLKNKLDQEGSIDIRELIEILDQIAKALDYAHSQGVIHLDVKPANILLSKKILSKNGRAVLSDFGVTRKQSLLINLRGKPAGTPAYNAPEQFDPNVTIDHRVDIYALGLVAYEALVGQNPVIISRGAKAGTSTFSTNLLSSIKHIPKPSNLKPDIPKPIEKVILKAIAYNRDERFSTASDFVLDLRAAILVKPRPKIMKPILAGLLVVAGILTVLGLFNANLWPFNSSSDGVAGVTLGKSETDESVVEDSSDVVSLGVSRKSGSTPIAKTPTSTVAVDNASISSSTGNNKATSTVAAIKTATPPPTRTINTSKTQVPQYTEKPDVIPTPGGQIDLINPTNNELIAQRAVSFSWRWTGNDACQSLPEGYGFEISIWPDITDASPLGAMNAKQSQSDILCDAATGIYSYEIGDISMTPGVQQSNSNRFRWQAALVNLDPYSPVILSTSRVIHIAPKE